MYNSWYEIVRSISPYNWAMLGIAFSLFLSIIGAAWGIFICGTSIMGASVKSPRIISKNLISIIFCEALGMYGVITAVFLQIKFVGINKEVHPPLVLMNEKDQLIMNTIGGGWALLASGLTAGLSNLVSGISVGITGSTCALADAQNSDLFVRMLMVEICASVIGLYGLIVAIVSIGDVQFT
ncbi:V-type proton ATPase 21 kDa proteolipid subunit, putative [Plasmodium gallinaceum]|uniref:V-type proton ATPase 21 kDa proteolipid subunit, putative n=1 Tax=Plasmodium gallinaceum TaxID=5849 RepID=A0A1J1GNK5_PLAGA|nr:V-type proton ATPase 21 kDa proteolipid subunit, putative [Plasmodium gallinaceum]CRG93900.1 V-type proton ATPase 21 kDa proteolipid subunit, putative [Plasmodium gallinaceum]